MAEGSANFDLGSFASQLSKGGAARGYLFEIIPHFPTAVHKPGVAGAYLVRTSSLPVSTLEPITMNWQGYDFKFPGKETFAEWTVSFTCDLRTEMHSAFMQWFSQIHDRKSNYWAEPTSLMVDQHASLLSYEDGKPIMTYSFYHAWPSAIGEIALDMAGTDVATFDVTFTYQYHTVKYEAAGGWGGEDYGEWTTG